REYRTFPDTHVKLLAHFPSGWDENNGPLYWEEFTKTGLIAQFGSSTVPHARKKTSGQAFQANGRIRSWSITSTRDRQGNAIDYTYNNTVNDDGSTAEVLPTRIDYTRHPNSPASRAVEFKYGGDNIKDTHTLFTGGTRVLLYSLLSSIRMLGP